MRDSETSTLQRLSSGGWGTGGREIHRCLRVLDKVYPYSHGSSKAVGLRKHVDPIKIQANIIKRGGIHPASKKCLNKMWGKPIY